MPRWLPISLPIGSSVGPGFFRLPESSSPEVTPFSSLCCTDGGGVGGREDGGVGGLLRLLCNDMANDINFSGKMSRLVPVPVRRYLC